MCFSTVETGIKNPWLQEHNVPHFYYSCYGQKGFIQYVCGDTCDTFCTIPLGPVTSRLRLLAILMARNSPFLATEWPHGTIRSGSQKASIGPSQQQAAQSWPHRPGLTSLTKPVPAFASTAIRELKCSPQLKASKRKKLSYSSKKPFKFHSIHSILILFCSLVGLGFQPDLHLASAFVNWQSHEAWFNQEQFKIYS